MDKISSYLTQALSTVTLFFKESFSFWPKISSREQLFQPPTEPAKYASWYIAVLVLLIVFGFILQSVSEKRVYPRFYKKYLSRLGSLFIYLPTVFVLLILVRMAGIFDLAAPVYYLVIFVAWLIWFVFLLYYRLAVVSRLWARYRQEERERKYIKHDKKK